MARRVGRFLTSACLAGLSLLASVPFKRAGLLDVMVPYQLMVLVAAFLLPMNWAVSCAVVFPTLSMLFFDMPEPVVALPLAVIQMIALAAFTNFFYSMLALNVFATALCSVAADFVLLFCAASIYGAVSRHAVYPLEYIRGAFMQTWPGIASQLILGPSCVLAIRAASRGRYGMPLSE